MRAYVYVCVRAELPVVCVITYNKPWLFNGLFCVLCRNVAARAQQRSRSQSPSSVNVSIFDTFSIYIFVYWQWWILIMFVDFKVFFSYIYSVLYLTLTLVMLSLYIDKWWIVGTWIQAFIQIQLLYVCTSYKILIVWIIFYLDSFGYEPLRATAVILFLNFCNFQTKFFQVNATELIDECIIELQCVNHYDSKSFINLLSFIMCNVLVASKYLFKSSIDVVWLIRMAVPCHWKTLWHIGTFGSVLLWISLKQSQFIPNITIFRSELACQYSKYVFARSRICLL